MKGLFSRYGGHSMIIGQGKASAVALPNDQSLDKMLDHFSKEIVSGVRYISSYDICPEYMGGYLKLPTQMVKIGELEHEFTDVFVQHELRVKTALYVGAHSYQNVFGLFICTDISNLDWYFGKTDKTYDYVLTTWFKEIEDVDLKRSPPLMEVMIVLLTECMGLRGTEVYFTPSKTYLGKKLSESFIRSFPEKIRSLKSDSDLVNLINSILNELSSDESK